MKKRTINFTLTAMALAAASSLQAAVFVDFRQGGTQTSYTGTIGLDEDSLTAVTSANNQLAYNSGSFTGGVANDSFGLTVTAAIDWDAAAAAAAIADVNSGAFGTYVADLTAGNLQGAGGGAAGSFGVNDFGLGDPASENNNNQFNLVGETAIFTFGSFSLDALTRLDITRVNFEGATAGDRMDYAFYDASTGTVTSSAFTITPGSFAFDNSEFLNVGDGDILVIAHAASIFRISEIGLELTTIPEPSSLALLGFGAGALCLRRRRK